MSKNVVWVVTIASLATLASVAIAQNSPHPRPPVSSDKGKVASAEESDFTRFRVVTDEGVLAVFDADEDWDGRDEPASQLAYWNDFATEQLFFFDQLLFTQADVLQSVAAMQRDLDIDPAQILSEKPEFTPLPEPTAPGQWRPATELDVLTVMAGGIPGAREGGAVSGVIYPCAPRDCGEAMAATGPIAGPIRGSSRSELFAMAQRDSRCTCGGGSPCSGPCCGSTDPCCGNSDPCCGDPNPCCGNPNPCCENPNSCSCNPECCGTPCCGEPGPCDEDIDGDGIPNGNDPDIDGDGIENGQEEMTMGMESLTAKMTTPTTTACPTAKIPTPTAAKAPAVDRRMCAAGTPIPVAAVLTRVAEIPIHVAVILTLAVDRRIRVAEYQTHVVGVPTHAAAAWTHVVNR